MSLSSSEPVLPGRFRLVLSSFLQQDGLPFADVLPEKVIDQACQEAGVEFGQDPDTIFTPAVTLWAFLSQMLHKQEQRSCLAAVSRVIVLFIVRG